MAGLTRDVGANPQIPECTTFEEQSSLPGSSIKLKILIQTFDLRHS